MDDSRRVRKFGKRRAFAGAIAGVFVAASVGVPGIVGTATAAPPPGIHVLAKGDPGFSPEPGWKGPYTAAQMGEKVFPMVPDGFNPLTATAKELAEYGLPPRPAAGSSAESAWINRMSHYKYEVPVEYYDAPNGPHTTLSASIGGNQAQKSTSYSGNEATPDYYTHVEAGWSVPTVTSTPVATYSSIWVGLYSTTGSQLLQDGTEQDWYSGKAHYSAWQEICCKTNPHEVPVSLAIHPGDSVGFGTDLISPNQVQFNIENDTTNTFLQPHIVSFSGTGWTKGYADAIVERPTVGSSLGKFADYGEVDFSSAYTYTDANNFQCIGALFHYDPHMYTDSSYTTQISAPYAFTDSSGCAFPVRRLNPSQYGN